MTTFESMRRKMVDEQIAARGVRDARVLEAMGSVPRESFLPAEFAEHAYADRPLPIGHGQTISQPYIVALMLEALDLGDEDRVLEVGTGSGYAAAIASRIAGQVYTVERHRSLAAGARCRFRELGYTNVEVRHGDGTTGWPEHARYDGIAVAAGGPQVPPALHEQIAPGGRLVMPVGTDPRRQHLVRETRVSEAGFRTQSLGTVRFVPLIGAAGWSEEQGTDRFREHGDRRLFAAANDVSPVPTRPAHCPMISTGKTSSLGARQRRSVQTW